MKILMVHNFYGAAAPSGENRVFEAERDLLLARGNEVVALTRQSDEIRSAGVLGTLKGALATPYNPFMARAIRKKVAEFKPDVVHVHNTFPLISPAIFHAIGNRAARVLTLHNYRLLCPAAIPMREDKVCTECLDLRSAWPALVHGCYRDSRLATLPLAANVALHRLLGTWQKEVDAFIALSEFQRFRMETAGLPAQRLYVKPNYFPGNPPVVPWSERGNYAVFAGRLSAEKGVRTLARGWLAWGGGMPELRMVGDGPLRRELESAVRGFPIDFLGQLSAADTLRQIAKARLLLLPSEWFETFGMTLIEAFAVGTPAAVSNLGALPSIVNHGNNGIVFQASSAPSLLSGVKSAWQSPGMLERLGAGARESFEQSYTEDSHYSRLIDIYTSAIERNLAARRL
jgi:glycosyltransferase involved in cell wall biosynthesis